MPTAAGLTGFIKTVLCLHHRTRSHRTLSGVESQNQALFEVQTKTETWQGERRFAGVALLVSVERTFM